MMLLRTLATSDAHGHTLIKVLHKKSGGLIGIEQGSLYPALYRMEKRGWVSSYRGRSENKRIAKFYRLTATGLERLAFETNRWRQVSEAINCVIGIPVFK